MGIRVVVAALALSMLPACVGVGPDTASPAGPAATSGATTTVAVAPTSTVGATAPPLSTTDSPSPTPRSAGWWLSGRKYGIHLLLDDGVGHWPMDVWSEHVHAARMLVGEGGYVVQLVRLDNLSPVRWQYFLNLCGYEHVTPVLRLATNYDRVNKYWEAPPPDIGSSGYTAVAARYREFLTQLHWPTPQHYVIIANEPNRGDEWSNRPSAAEYARFLADTSAALRPIGVTVLGPSLDMYSPHTNGQPVAGYRYLDAETFVDEMAAAVPDVFSSIDVWSSHAYPLDAFRFDPSRQELRVDYLNGAGNPRHATPPDGIYNRGVNSYRWELWKVRQYLGSRADSIPVMVTETGWRHASTQDPAARDSAQAEISDDRLAAYVDLAYHGNRGRYPDQPESGWSPWTEEPRVIAAVLFALGGNPPDWGHTNWVRLDRRGGIAGVYPFFERMSLFIR